MIEGFGLHGGARASLAFTRRPGPLTIRRGDTEAAFDAFEVVDTTRSTTVATRGMRIQTVEHLFAALAGLGIRRDVLVTLEGPEIPLADGGSRVFADALRTLDVACAPPAIVVAHTGLVEVGASRYAFRPADAVSVVVQVDFDDARLAEHASWNGDAEDFRLRIAPARTFGFEGELLDLLERGLASHVAPESVIVVAKDRILSAGSPFAADEIARHKLLDLVGDMYFHGGPPRGEVIATRPGHAATHEAMRRARERGVIAVR